MPNGLVPSMIMDFASLSPLNLARLFKNKSGLGYDDMSCHNNAECFGVRNNSSYIKYILWRTPIIVYILVLTLLYLILKNKGY